MLGLLCTATPAHADSNSNNWPSAGQNLSNTRYQSSGGGISVQTVAGLTQKWVFTTCTGSDCLDTVLQLRLPCAGHKPDGLPGVT